MADEPDNLGERRPRRLSTAWLLSPIMIGLVLLVIAIVGNYHWHWSGFVTGTIVNFASSVSLVSVWFLFERRFEKREAALRRTYAGLRRADARRQNVTEALNALLVALSETEHIQIPDIACSVYLVEGHLIGNQELREFVRVTLGMSPSSAVRWTKGKGVIGRCWETEAITHVNLHRLNERLADITEERYYTLTESARMNMSYAESRMTVGNVGEILAVPIHVDARFAGCVAVSIRENGQGADHSVLDSAQARESAIVAGRVVAFML
jgi:hypothetical protein